ncbi:hypothetical protein [Swingsia samuiensis]|uniref:Uncharacterized protein n=1 Tax=Swingsia samuiensis TaxID=1293412 RepID=A0A4Y6UJE9_9PROT|nr:hypothetical protein [Swingsia samuiensis]QDH17184.1 hypothetical protein E3D00_06100 [Swingsia samuiensis]
MPVTDSTTCAPSDKPPSVLSNTNTNTPENILLNSLNFLVQSVVASPFFNTLTASTLNEAVNSDAVQKKIQSILSQTNLPSLIAEAKDSASLASVSATQATASQNAAAISEHNAATSSHQADEILSEIKATTEKAVYDASNTTIVNINTAINAQKNSPGGVAGLSENKHLSLNGFSTIGVSDDGHLLLSIDIPTQDPLVPGALWNNGQYIMISTGEAK